MAAKLTSKLFPYVSLGLLAGAAGANVYGCSSDNNTQRDAGGTTGTSTGTSGTATGTSGTATGASGTASGSSGTATGTSGTATGASGTATGASGTAGVSEGGTSMCSLPAAPPGLILYSGGVPAPACPGGIALSGQSWFSYNDGTSDAGTFVHTADFGGCDGPTDCAYHTSGGGFTGYGAGVGFTLNSNNPLPGDAGASYTGFQVWLKGTTSGTRQVGYALGPNFVHVKFVTSTNREGDEFGAYCPTASDGGDAWVLCKLPFTGLTRDGFKGVDAGAPDPTSDVFDPQNLEKIQFEMSSYTPPADSGITVNVVNFDVWIDDAAFF